MAKLSMRLREARRVKLSSLPVRQKKRSTLKAVISSQVTGYEEKMAAMKKLNKVARDESPCRVKRRCRSCGRPRAVYRKFALCRICLRNTAMQGFIPGLIKASW